VPTTEQAVTNKLASAFNVGTKLSYDLFVRDIELSVGKCELADLIGNFNLN
jgi:hypothetical protein